VDGEHHFTQDGLDRDAERDTWLAAQGYRILRFNTGEIADSFDGCLEEILAALDLTNDTPTPGPTPQGGGGR
jgi:very-short-patch-repair endonuclease